MVLDLLKLKSHSYNFGTPKEINKLMSKMSPIMEEYTPRNESDRGIPKTDRNEPLATSSQNGAPAISIGKPIKASSVDAVVIDEILVLEQSVELESAIIEHLEPTTNSLIDLPQEDNRPEQIEHESLISFAESKFIDEHGRPRSERSELPTESLSEEGMVRLTSISQTRNPDKPTKGSLGSLENVFETIDSSQNEPNDVLEPEETIRNCNLAHKKPNSRQDLHRKSSIGSFKWNAFFQVLFVALTLALFFGLAKGTPEDMNDPKSSLIKEVFDCSRRSNPYLLPVDATYECEKPSFKRGDRVIFFKAEVLKLNKFNNEIQLYHCSVTNVILGCQEGPFGYLQDVKKWRKNIPIKITEKECREAVTKGKSTYGKLTKLDNSNWIAGKIPDYHCRLWRTMYARQKILKIVKYQGSYSDASSCIQSDLTTTSLNYKILAPYQLKHLSVV